jgi:hypothetical protein
MLAELSVCDPGGPFSVRLEGKRIDEDRTPA